MTFYMGTGKPKSMIIQEAVTVHYNKFNTNGLRPVEAFFKRNGFPIKKVEVDPKVKKRTGMPTKKVVFHFENGQTLEVVFAFTGKEINRSLGFAFEAKVDGKKVPIKQAGSKKPQTAETLKKLVSFLEQSEPAASKRQKAIASKVDLKINPNKRVINTVAARLKTANERKDQLKTALGTSTEELRQVQETSHSLLNRYGELQTEIDNLKAKNQELDNEYDSIVTAA